MSTTNTTTLPVLSSAEKKRIQTNSIILRQMVMMQMLINYCGFTFVLCSPKRKAAKSLSYFPIEKIYSVEGELCFDTEMIEISTEDEKIRYCQTFAIEMMIQLLENSGCQFNKKQTKKATEIKNEMQAITLTKILSLSLNGNVFDMVGLEQSMGMEYHKYIEECFEGGYEKIIIGCRGSENAIIQNIHTKKRIEEAVLILCNNCDEMIEKEYCKGSYLNTNSNNDADTTK